MRFLWPAVLFLCVQARPRGDGATEAAQQCLFVLATPGSGSTSLLKLFQEHSRCEMTGENWGAFIGLGAFDQALADTLEQPRADAHDEAAWRRVFRPDAVRQKQLALVRSVLNPNGPAHGCFGFKEVRYGRGLERVDSFGRDVGLLSRLCARPVVVLHTRRRIESELGATIIDTEKQTLMTQLQWACFDAFAGNLSRARALDPDAAERVLAGCAREPDAAGASPLRVRRHTLEDYLEQTPSHLALWELLGLAPPPASETIRLRTDAQAAERDGADRAPRAGSGGGAFGSVGLRARVRVIRGPYEGAVGIVIQKWAAMLKVRPAGKGAGSIQGRRVFQVRSADVVAAPPRPARRDRALASERQVRRRQARHKPPDPRIGAGAG